MELKLHYSNFDMYSKKLGFYFQNHEKIGSYFGLFLSLVYIVVSLFLLFFQVLSLFKRNELNVYDSTIYAQEMPSIKVDKNLLYFAFGLEEPTTSKRFIDEGIYIPKVAFVEKVKINDELVTVKTTQLPLERCNVTNFGENYQHLFTKNELDNSYCLKNFTYELDFAGGYKYEKFNYMRLRIYPCVNNSNNNYSCKPQSEIDDYLASGYFSILIKDFGLNPSNYSQPVVPTFQDLYTTIDKRIYRNYILNFGITEVHTDTGIINEKITKDRYFQYRKEIQTFTFRDEQEYYKGKSIILVQFKIDDAVIIQKRSYTKIAEIFSRIGGYMQLMNTVFLLISLLMNKLDAELKILNSIFNFNIKEKKLTLKYRSLNSLYSSNESKLAKNIEINTSSKNKNSNSKDSEINENSNLYIILNNNKNQENQINKNKNLKTFEESKNIENSNIIKYKKEENVVSYQKDNLKKTNTKEEVNINKIPKGYINHLNLNCFDRLLKGKFFNKRKNVQLFNLSRVFYRKRMDIVISFSRSFLFEKLLLKDDFNKSYSIKEIEL